MTKLKQLQTDRGISPLDFCCFSKNVAEINDNSSYSLSNYDGINIDKQTLEMTDKENNGGILLVGNPLIRKSEHKNTLRLHSIYELKQILSCYNSLNFSDYLSFSKIRDAISFYEQQVIRQANEYRWCRHQNISDLNIFLIDKVQKLRVIEEQIEEVLMYLITNGTEFVWGTLSDFQKELLIKVIIKSQNAEAKLARECMIDVISNYTTLGELEEGLVRTRVINRFIKQK